MTRRSRSLGDAFLRGRLSARERELVIVAVSTSEALLARLHRPEPAAGTR